MDFYLVAFDVSVAGSETRTITRKVEAASLEAACQQIRGSVIIKIRAASVYGGPIPPPLDPKEPWIPAPPPTPDAPPPPDPS